MIAILELGVLSMNVPKSIKREDRKINLLQILQARECIELDELAGLLEISVSTLRREVHELVEAGYMRINAGVVELTSANGEEIPFEMRELVNRDEKKRIAQAALEFIQNGDTVFISGGTTTLELAKLLPGKRRLTVITNSMRVAIAVLEQPGIELVILGGKVRPEEQTMHGHLTEMGAQELRADLFFYGIPSIHPVYGLTHSQTNEVNTDRSIATAVKKIIVLVDQIWEGGSGLGAAVEQDRPGHHRPRSSPRNH
jgi:DeoR/GlpR family transcriptional regulator of sugar metabolism